MRLTLNLLPAALTSTLPLTRHFSFRRLALAAVIVTALLPLSGNLSVQAEKAKGKHGPIPWATSLDKAKTTAAKQKKLMLVDFSADWCGPCQEMLATTYQNKRVVEHAKKFIPVLIDVDKNQPLVQKYKVQGFPTVLFINPNGTVVLRSEGFADTDTFLHVMNIALSENNKLTAKKPK